MYVFLFYIALDILCVGMGMGVPFFCILLGFPTGWYIARTVAPRNLGMHGTLWAILGRSAATSAVTFVMMLLPWGYCLPMVYAPTEKLANFGIPLILFEPRASFIGWLVLMILISPFLQFLMTLFGAHMALVITTDPSLADTPPPQA